VCVIIDRPANVTIPPDILDRAMQQNRDGWGVMYAQKGRIKAWVGTDYKVFRDLYAKLPADVHLTLHFRIATHGKVQPSNCHPVTMGHRRRWAVMHNGILWPWTTELHDPRDADRSDTWRFAATFLSPYLHSLGKDWKSNRVETYLEKVVGYSNKLVILGSDGERMFVNKSSGRYHGGCWYSHAGPLSSFVSDSYAYDKGRHSVHTPTVLRRRERYNSATKTWEPIEDDDTPFLDPPRLLGVSTPAIKDAGVLSEDACARFTARMEQIRTEALGTEGADDADGDLTPAERARLRVL